MIDKDKYQQFSFASYEDLQAFVEFCESLIIPQADYEVEEVRCIYNYGDHRFGGYCAGNGIGRRMVN